MIWGLLTRHSHTPLLQAQTRSYNLSTPHHQHSQAQLPWIMPLTRHRWNGPPSSGRPRNEEEEGDMDAYLPRTISRSNNDPRLCMKNNSRSRLLVPRKTFLPSRRRGRRNARVCGSISRLGHGRSYPSPFDIPRSRLTSSSH